MSQRSEDRDADELKDAFAWYAPRIVAFGLVSPAPPSGGGIPSGERGVRGRQMENDLVRSRYFFSRLDGRYAGEIESPYIILNVPRSTIEGYAQAFKQKLFVYGLVDDDRSIRYEYWEHTGNFRDARVRAYTPTVDSEKETVNDSGEKSRTVLDTPSFEKALAKVLERVLIRRSIIPASLQAEFERLEAKNYLLVEKNFAGHHGAMQIARLRNLCQRISTRGCQGV